MACIKENLNFTKLSPKAVTMQTDVLTALRRLEGEKKFDYIFMDPPYRQGLEEDVLRFLSKSDILKPDTKIIVEASLDTDFSYLEGLGYHVYKEKKYKTNQHVFMQKKD